MVNFASPRKPGSLFPNGEPSTFLADVTCVVLVTYDGMDETEDLFVMRPHENTKGRFVTRLGLRRRISGSIVIEAGVESATGGGIGGRRYARRFAVAAMGRST